MIGVTDVIFAVDSIPAIFAITTDPFIVLTSNVFAVLGLRALYFLLAGMAEKFHLLTYGLAAVLVFIGTKMLLVGRGEDSGVPVAGRGRVADRDRRWCSACGSRRGPSGRGADRAGGACLAGEAAPSLAHVRCRPFRRPRSRTGRRARGAGALQARADTVEHGGVVVLGAGVLRCSAWFPNLQPYSLQPQVRAGLLGVLTAPLLHGSIGHLAANALSVLILGTLAGTVFPRATLRALPVIWIGSGLGTWLIATGGFHLGASGVTHGLGFLVFTLGILRRDRPAIAAALIAFFFFGGMLMSVLPQELGVSWEYHLSGAVFGVVSRLHLAPRRSGAAAPALQLGRSRKSSPPETTPGAALARTRCR